MGKKVYLYLWIAAVLVIALTFLVTDFTKQHPTRMKQTTLIFKLNSNYSGNYIGTINYYEDTNTYRSFGTFELFDYCYMVSKSNDVYDDLTGEKVYDGMDSEEEVCFDMNSDDQLKKGGIKRLSNNYYAVIVPDSEAMIKGFAIFDKSIITKAISESDRVSIVPVTFPNGIRPGMGDSIEMSREEFYNYVIEESPLIEAYFCDDEEKDLDAVVKQLSHGSIPATCQEIAL